MENCDLDHFVGINGDAYTLPRMLKSYDTESPAQLVI